MDTNCLNFIAMKRGAVLLVALAGCGAPSVYEVTTRSGQAYRCDEVFRYALPSIIREADRTLSCYAGRHKYEIHESDVHMVRKVARGR